MFYSYKLETEKYNKFDPDKLVHPCEYPDPKYKVGDINMWCLVDGEIIVGQIVAVYPAQISDDHIIRYSIKVLNSDHGNYELYVSEDMAVGYIDDCTYNNANKISGYNPLNTNLDNKSNNTDFKCNIDDLKTDIDELRTHVDKLLENTNPYITNQYRIAGDIAVLKQHDLDTALYDDTVITDIRNDVRHSNETCERLDNTVDYCLNKIDTIQTDLVEVNHQTKQASKLSKLSLLGNLAKFL